MAKEVKVIVLRTAGTNCDQETAFAFHHFGAKVDLIHINQLLDAAVRLNAYHILAIPGGFTYGDDIESGRILANEIRIKLAEPIKKFINDKKLVIGICNGFQVLVKAGILPDVGKKHDFVQSATLTNNTSGKFEDRWIYLKIGGKSPWMRKLPPRIYLPVAHAEGKFLTDEKTLEQLNRNQQIAFRYCAKVGGKPQYPENPNGSTEDIAGITDPTGHILGLMPHPERHFRFEQHPFWTRLKKSQSVGDGAQIFKNGVEYIRSTLL